MVELENIEGMMKFRRDISSRRLFCKGVPVSNKRRCAYRKKKRYKHPNPLCSILLDVTDRNIINLMTEMTVAQSLGDGGGGGRK